MNKQKLVRYVFIACIFALGIWCYNDSHPDSEAINMYITHANAATPISPIIQHYSRRGSGGYADSLPIHIPTVDYSDSELVSVVFNQKRPNSVIIDQYPIDDLNVPIGAQMLSNGAIPLEFKFSKENEIIFSVENTCGDYQLIIITGTWKVIGPDIMTKYIVLFQC